jgi:MinD superfamily P-loop ATPase
LAFEVVKKQVALLKELKMPIVGIVENMKMQNSAAIEQEAAKLGLKYLGAIAYDAKVEASIGSPAKLLATAMGEAMDRIKKAAVGKGNSKCPPKQ